ncbi:PREDICTED: putative protein FAM10A4 [Polistes dominula]|uniref:Hsp70-interacting protein N-terminal domain-containing protein n=1 Tax=Polistes dominula TaxID=743375 RepID=A0ABM1IKU2_POLDO|nr:PREDICTED: putative protein FAM10A4 [Polistes dominula]XP_015180829.1 PREDICTED: putative protein FAM10A4 [Polistes dominula]XP_015180830.1 PREDICTED: putative protein FAM10A4 [Polistes dominula]
MSMPNLNLEHLDELKAFVEMCKSQPWILCRPELAFVKSLIEHFGGKVDPVKSKNETESKFEETESKPQVESEESDLELDMTGVIEPDTDTPQEMGNSALEPTEEEIAESQIKRSEAVSAFVEKDYEKAIQLYTEAIKLNPQTALLYAKRGQVYLLLKKPNACIRDCNRALELNPDSAAGHKFRGRAYHLLGKWEEAVNDLRLACKFDFDEQADEWLREATPNARKIEEHKRKKERKLEEKLKQTAEDENVKKAKEKKPEKTNEKPNEKVDISQFLRDPEILESFLDPEIFEAFKDISNNPSNFVKYCQNKKITAFIEKVGRKFGSGGTTGIADVFQMMSNMSGSSVRNASQFNTPKSSQQPQDDVGLD